MAGAIDTTSYIYEGFWTDWSKGSMWRLTWTLSPTSATILTNSVAVFVTLCGVQLWTIVRYILHQRSASLLSAAATPHLKKQQLILRNASSALATAQLMLELAWNSRRSSGKRSLRAYTIGLLATIYAISFMVAGVLSNKAIIPPLTNGGSAVLLRSNHCGIWNETYRDIVTNNAPSNEEEFDMMIQYYANRIHEVQLSLQYAQECYMSEADITGTSPACHSLKANTVGRAPFLAGSCPFESQICVNTAKAVILDTGDIDSLAHLGINAKPSDRLKYRRITTCAVLNGTSHVSGWNGTIKSSSSTQSLGPSLETAYAYYGPSLNEKTAWTYSHSNSVAFATNSSSQATRPYQVYIQQAQPVSGSNDFEPIQELAQKDKDLNLIFLSFAGTYLQPVHDPWFAANIEQSFDTSSRLFQNRYAPDVAISTIGCTEQHQFCTSNNTCTGFHGFDQVQDIDLFNAALNPHQNATFDRVLRAVASSRLWDIVPGLERSSTPLLANSLTRVGYSGAVVSQVLPDDQWKLEIQYWHSVAMAQLQRTVVQWATGKIAAETQYLLPASNPQDRWFCENLIVPSAVYQSFSVAAIVLIVVFGTLITLISQFIEELAALVQRWSRKSDPRKLWDHDDILQFRSSTTTALWKPPPVSKDQGYIPASRPYQHFSPVSNGSRTTSSIDGSVHAPPKLHIDTINENPLPAPYLATPARPPMFAKQNIPVSIQPSTWL